MTQDVLGCEITLEIGVLDDIGPHRFAGLGVGDWHDGSLKHGLHLGQRVLDLIRVDVEARHQHEVFLAINDAQEAVFVHHRHVAGEKPALLQGLGGFLGAMPIARHHLRAAHHHLAGGARGHRLAIVVHQNHIAARHGDADAARLGAVIQRVKADQGRGFGQPVTFGQGRAGHGTPAGCHRLVQRRAPGNGGTQFLGRIGGEPFLVHQPVEERVNPGDPGDRVILDRALQVLHRARRRDQDIAGTDFEKGQQIRGEGKDVIQRQRGQHAVIGGHQPA